MAWDAVDDEAVLRRGVVRVHRVVKFWEWVASLEGLRE